MVLISDWIPFTPKENPKPILDLLSKLNINSAKDNKVYPYIGQSFYRRVGNNLELRFNTLVHPMTDKLHIPVPIGIEIDRSSLMISVYPTQIRVTAPIR